MFRRSIRVLEPPLPVTITMLGVLVSSMSPCTVEPVTVATPAGLAGSEATSSGDGASASAPRVIAAHRPGGRRRVRDSSGSSGIGVSPREPHRMDWRGREQVAKAFDTGDNALSVGDHRSRLRKSDGADRTLLMRAGA